MWSKLKAKQRSSSVAMSNGTRLRAVARAALSWDAANAAAWWAAYRLPKGASYLVTYEELANDAEETIRRIYDWLDLGLEATRQAKRTRHVDHLVTGNRMRMTPLGEIRPDASWRENLTRSEIGIFRTLSWPWALWHRREVRRAFESSNA